jgi:ABC-type branched-subunit amino acid transport system permease subunit
MRLLDNLARRFVPRQLTRTRMVLVIAMAVVADGLQMLLGPLGWLGVDEVIDVVTMALAMWLLGFHPLLLPTFLVEFIPLVDMLPTWTGCVVAVIALRKRAQATSVVTAPPKEIGDGSNPPAGS